MTRPPELHLFILWNHALAKTAEILEDLKGRFTVHRVYEMRWSDARFSDNMSRFYGQKLPRNSAKETHCGRGPFLAVVAIDEAPEYAERETSRGPLAVNTKCFDAKQVYRARTGGGHRIHATNSPAETDHDLVLLLGHTASEFLELHPEPWDGRVELHERDLTGADGWNDISELFHVLNSASLHAPYALLRNWEGLPHAATLPGHGDIDVLCTNSRETAFLANAFPVSPEPHRVLHRTSVGGKELLFDFREVGDDYYDANWERDMLARRVYSPEGFFHLCKEDYFHSLLYHAAVHKPEISEDYVVRLMDLSRDVAPLFGDALSDPAQIRSILDSFMSKQGYGFVEPRDTSVYFNAGFAGTTKMAVGRILQSSRTLTAAFRRIFDQSEDCSIEAPEFADAVFRTKHLARYFSPNRTMFLEALDLPRSAAVLEIDAQSGVLTRWLGDRFSSVTATEVHPGLAEVVGRRCRDLAGVHVLQSACSDFKGPQEFDLAVAIMNAPVKPGRTEPVLSAVQCARRALKKTGLLVLGIDSDAPIPALRDEVVQQLRSNGFSAVQVVYPFPDVILPRVVFSELAVRSSRKSFGYWAAFATRDSGIAGTGELETAAASVRGALDSVATSCYILAARTPAGIPPIRWQAWATSSESRHPSFRSSTVVTEEAGGAIVRKRGTPKESGVFRFNPVMDCPLFEGHTESAALLYALRTGNLDQFMTLLKLHVQHLSRELAYVETNCPPLLTEGDMLLRGEALDAIPQNTALEDNAYKAFDLEWGVTIPLPLSYVLYRGLSVLFHTARPDVICKVFRLKEYGVAENPQLKDICVFFVNALRIFPALQDRAIHHMMAFERRFAEFVGSGEVSPAGVTLFELYHGVIALESQGRHKESMAALAQLQSAYPDAPEADTLTAALNAACLT